MLSYQHGFHAGNLADVHKHALLAWMLAYLCRKPKPFSYLETHAGRALYDLTAGAALKTGEAQAGIARVLAQDWFGADHPYMQVLAAIRARHGATAYPGSPLLAAEFLRPGDRMALAELHPQENAALQVTMRGSGARIVRQDGFEMMQSICPPTPRRGLLLIDPSFEVKTDYQTIPGFIKTLNRKWNVGIIALWYPLLADGRHRDMLAMLEQMAFRGALRHEVAFPAARAGHGMTGSGLFVVNAPYGLAEAAATLGILFARA